MAKKIKVQAGASASAGYSGTPLIKKLGIKPGMAMCVLGAPAHYEVWSGLKLVYRLKDR